MRIVLCSLPFGGTRGMFDSSIGKEGTKETRLMHSLIGDSFDSPSDMSSSNVCLLFQQEYNKDASLTIQDAWNMVCVE